MVGQKRDYRGNAKRFEHRDKAPPKEIVRNAYTPMFERFRDELDEHHDRKERIVKASRDITALSKKIIFTLQRVRRIHQDLPNEIEKDIQIRLVEVRKLLSSISSDVQGINRWRYMRNMSCVEELIEALTFAHYLRHQDLMSYAEAVQAVHDLSVPERDEDATDMELEHPTVSLTEDDYLMGVFDLSGEMMRFATTTAALNGRMAGSSLPADGEDGGALPERTIVTDMQDLGSFYEMLPQQPGKSYQMKLQTLRTSVLKVERLGYGLTVRGSERPAGWMPDTNDSEPGSPA